VRAALYRDRAEGRDPLDDAGPEPPAADRQ
jgi:hypothetical protein